MGYLPYASMQSAYPSTQNRAYQGTNGYPQSMVGSGYGSQPQSSYGAAGSSDQQYPTPSRPYGEQEQKSAQDLSLAKVLTAHGVPNDKGDVLWPLGLRILAARETDELRTEIDALLHRAAQEAVAGTVSAALVREMETAIRKLRRLLLTDKEERFGMPLAVYEESERFLDKLGRARRLLERGMVQPTGRAELGTATDGISEHGNAYIDALPLAKGSKTIEVGLYDNHFEPNVLRIAAGTTVQWTNHGQHRHTISADNGKWESGEVAPGNSYTYTFAWPGTYPYHCNVHADMRGRIVVK
jgi:plastocyanin